jgi:hypothetical protein
VQELGRIEVPRRIFRWRRDLRFAALGVQIRGFGTQESREFGDAGARVVVSVSWVGVEDGGVEEVAAAGWEREGCHFDNVSGVSAVVRCDGEGSEAECFEMWLVEKWNCGRDSVMGY